MNSLLSLRCATIKHNCCQTNKKPNNAQHSTSETKVCGSCTSACASHLGRASVSRMLKKKKKCRSELKPAVPSRSNMHAGFGQGPQTGPWATPDPRWPSDLRLQEVRQHLIVPSCSLQAEPTHVASTRRPEVCSHLGPNSLESVVTKQDEVTLSVFFGGTLTKSIVNPTPARFLFPNMLLRLHHDAGDSRARHFCRNPAWEFFPLAWRV